MPEEKKYTLLLNPDEKRIYRAGPYNEKENKPKYEIDIWGPKAARELVVFVPKVENSEMYYNFYNGSKEPILVLVKRDGVLLKDRLS